MAVAADFQISAAVIFASTMLAGIANNNSKQVIDDLQSEVALYFAEPTHSIILSTPLLYRFSESVHRVYARELFVAASPADLTRVAELILQATIAGLPFTF